MPPSFRKIRDAADADACLAALGGSGLPLTAWAHANGVDARSLNMWRINKARSSSPLAPGALRLVELVAKPPVEAPPLRVHVEDLVIEVPAGFDGDALGRLVAVLRRC